MAEFDGIFCSPFLPSVFIIERGGWDGVGWVGSGKWQKPLFGTPMSSHDAHTVANDDDFEFSVMIS